MNVEKVQFYFYLIKKNREWNGTMAKRSEEWMRAEKKGRHMDANTKERFQEDHSVHSLSQSVRRVWMHVMCVRVWVCECVGARVERVRDDSITMGEINESFYFCAINKILIENSHYIIIISFVRNVILLQFNRRRRPSVSFAWANANSRCCCRRRRRRRRRRCRLTNI